MKMTIYKFTLTPGIAGQWHLMPANARILAAGDQREGFVIWVELDLDAPTIKRYFTVYGTGHSLPDDPGAYIGSAQFMNGQLVFHAYESATPTV